MVLPDEGTELTDVGRDDRNPTEAAWKSFWVASRWFSTVAVGHARHRAPKPTLDDVVSRAGLDRRGAGVETLEPLGVARAHDCHGQVQAQAGRRDDLELAIASEPAGIHEACRR